MVKSLETILSHERFKYWPATQDESVWATTERFVESNADLLN